jgi:hypothetical protein
MRKLVRPQLAAFLLTVGRAVTWWGDIESHSSSGLGQHLID